MIRRVIDRIVYKIRLRMFIRLIDKELGESNSISLSRAQECYKKSVKTIWWR